MKMIIRSIANGIIMFQALLMLICVTRTYILLTSSSSPQLAVTVTCEKQMKTLVDHCQAPSSSCSDQLGWERLFEAVKIPTLSGLDVSRKESSFHQMLSFILNTYHDVFLRSFIKVEVINLYSLLITVQGTNKNLKPYLLLSHVDVKASSDPLMSYIEDGVMYGPGTVDSKLTVIGILQALSKIVENDDQPAKSFYIAIGHDQEAGGGEGARYLSNLLRSRGVEKLSFILDEGLPAVRNLVSHQVVAPIGVSEPGEMVVKVSYIGNKGSNRKSANSQTGFSAVTKAVEKLRERIDPGHMDLVTQKFIKTIGPFLNFPLNVVSTNQWLFQPMIDRAMNANANTRQVISTVSELMSVYGGGTGHNIESMAPPSYALVKQLIHISSDVARTLESMKQLIDDRALRVDLVDDYPSHNPPPISPHSPLDEPFQLIKDSFLKVHKNAIVAPAVTALSTDSRHYLQMCKNVYRFRPVILERFEIKRINTRDECIGKQNFYDSVEFYERLMRNADSVFT